MAWKSSPETTAGYALSVAGEANRHARGVCCGIYPITRKRRSSNTSRDSSSQGTVVHVESEHTPWRVIGGA